MRAVRGLGLPGEVRVAASLVVEQNLVELRAIPFGPRDIERVTVRLERDDCRGGACAGVRKDVRQYVFAVSRPDHRLDETCIPGLAAPVFTEDEREAFGGEAKFLTFYQRVDLVDVLDREDTYLAGARRRRGKVGDFERFTTLPDGLAELVHDPAVVLIIEMVATSNPTEDGSLPGRPRSCPIDDIGFDRHDASLPRLRPSRRETGSSPREVKEARLEILVTIPTLAAPRSLPRQHRLLSAGDPAAAPRGAGPSGARSWHRSAHCPRAGFGSPQAVDRRRSRHRGGTGTMRGRPLALRCRSRQGQGRRGISSGEVCPRALAR
jgi:hypothetical protein